eukprot:TRINITY_DN52582_c0_g1_i1.p1 TRINITY_DN52582_c0_g1~~TRINITY_DN52582_c0_g1_i1.p1  ORF type:complete len:100 (-),score=12.36 TRINITY_DN52582_c0_g1_i1:73-339(-)
MFKTEYISLKFQEAYELLDSDLEEALTKVYDISTLAAIPMLNTVVGHVSSKPWFDVEWRQTLQSVNTLSDHLGNIKKMERFGIKTCTF